MPSAGNVTFCDLKQFSKDFRSIHIYLSFVICTLGSILNAFNIFILSTKQMKSPTNLILTALAIADVIVMLEYMPFAYLQHEVSLYFTYNFATFLIVHAVFTNAFHFISCSLAIILAIWRYVAVKFPQNNQKLCDESRTKCTVILTYISCACVCIPLMASMKVNSQNAYKNLNGTIVFNKSMISNFSEVTNITIYHTGYRNSIFKAISFYVYGIVLKLIPCILLVLLSTLLVIELFKAKRRKKQLMQSNNKETQCLRKKRPHQKHTEKEKQFNRTTKMLLAVLLLFLMAEFPQAMLGLLLHILGEKFANECYMPLGDLMDIFTLTISAINFVLYCIMSQKFREVFREHFFPAYFTGSNSVKNQWISLQTVNTVV